MQHFAAQLKPDNNSSLLQLQGDGKRLKVAFEGVQEALVQGKYGGPFSAPEDIVAEYRVALGMNWMFVGSEGFFRRLEWWCLAEGWNAAKVVSTPGQGMFLRLFSLTEEVVVNVTEGEPFQLTFTPPDGFTDLAQPDIEALIASVVKDGAWRYSAGYREFVPAVRIASVRHTLAP